MEKHVSKNMIYVESFLHICDGKVMLENLETIHWPQLMRPLSAASIALGRLACALEATTLHPTWLWREITRVSVLIAQANGYHARVDQLRLALIGAPLERDQKTPGLAAAQRVFLASAPLFRKLRDVDSKVILWPSFWSEVGSEPAKAGRAPRRAEHGSGLERAGEVAADRDPFGEEEPERDQLMKLVRDLSAFAEDGQRPALLNLLIDLKKHAATRKLPPPLVRIAMPLALAEAGLVPRAAPGLLGGRRLALGFSRAAPAEKPLSDWLRDGLDALAKEAEQSYRRLLELTRQHQAWHDALAKEGLRKHARVPKALDLLAATPVVSIGMVASHLSCSHVTAGRVVERLLALGILIEQTSRVRHKVYIAGDLPRESQGSGGLEGALSVSAPLRPVDVDALSPTLDDVFADLDRRAALTKARLSEEAG